MLPTEDLFVHLYVLADDALIDKVVAIPPRPGPVPACSEAEVLTVALVRHLLGRRSEAGWLAEVRRDWAHLFPRLPHQSEFNRRVRWLWGACEVLRAHLAARVPEDPWQQVDTSALPVRHPSRVRGPDGWTGPAHLAAGLGRDAAHAEWFYGFRLALRADLGSRLGHRAGRRLRTGGRRRPAGWHRAAGRAAAGRGFAGRACARHAAPPWSWPTPAPSATSSAKPSAARLPRCATGSKPPAGRSPIILNSPVTGAHLLGPAHQGRRHPGRPHPATTPPHMTNPHNAP